MSRSLIPALRTLTHLAFVAACATLLATQSRGVLGGVGIGELSGLVFVALAWRLPGGLPAWASLSMALLWTGFVVGATANLFSGLSTQLALRDLAALVFALVFAASAVAHLRSRPDPLAAASNALTAGVLVQLLPLLMFFAGIDSPAWLTDSDEPGLPFISRYTGFANNPNQLGVLLCAYPVLALAAVRGLGSRASRALALLGLMAAILLAVLIRSNTVFAAYILATAVWVVLRFNLWDTPARSGYRLGRLLLTLLFSAFVVTGFFFFAQESIDKTDSADANGRFPLWLNAIEGILQSVFLGVGPGGQSGPYSPFQGDEAHNFLLDITLQGGAISLLAYLFLLFCLIRQVLHQRSLLAACVLLAVLTQQVSHYTARQPIAWLYLLFPLVLATPRRRLALPALCVNPGPAGQSSKPIPAL